MECNISDPWDPSPLRSSALASFLPIFEDSVPQTGWCGAERGGTPFPRTDNSRTSIRNCAP